MVCHFDRQMAIASLRPLVDDSSHEAIDAAFFCVVEKFRDEELLE
jgi:hypothetical protein